MGGSSTDENARDIYTETILFLYEKVRTHQINLLRNKENEIYLKNTNGKDTLLSTYLYEVARRKWLKSSENPNKKKSIEYFDDYKYDYDEFEDETPTGIPEEDEKEINKNFDKLSLTCQMVILLKKICKVKHEEIAEFRGITNGAARNLFINCWNNLIGGIEIKRKENRLKPKKSKINIIRLLEIFFDNWKSDKNIWLWSEAAEKSFYQTLKKELEDKFKNIITENSKIAEKIKVLKEIISFLDEKQNIKLDLYKQDKESSDYFNKRNTRFEKKYNELTVSSRFMLLLHHVAHSDKLKIAEFFELEDDISALRGIHESKLEMMKGIMNDTMLELYNDKTENFE